MSNVEVKCPRCGSPCNLKKNVENEYECKNCQATFRFVDPSHKTVIHKVLANTCVSCGAPIKRGEGFACIECKKDALCSNCVRIIKGKYNCIECYNTKTKIVGSTLICPLCHGDLSYILSYNRWFCNVCQTWANHVCPFCGSQMNYCQDKSFFCNICKKTVSAQTADSQRRRQYRRENEDSLPWY